MGKLVWENLPTPLSAFTQRNATMRDLNSNKIIQYYSANTKISLAQKAQRGEETYYRTASAKENNLDWGFEAKAFGLQNDVAPLAHDETPNTPSGNFTRPMKDKQKAKKVVSPESGEGEPKGVLKRLASLFRK